MADQVDQDVVALKERVEALRLSSQRAEVAAEAAAAEYERALERLRTEFGVSSLEEAQALLARIDDELVREMAAVAAALEEAGEK